MFHVKAYKSFRKLNRNESFRTRRFKTINEAMSYLNKRHFLIGLESLMTLVCIKVIYKKKQIMFVCFRNDKWMFYLR